LKINIINALLVHITHVTDGAGACEGGKERARERGGEWAMVEEGSYGTPTISVRGIRQKTKGG